MPNEDGVGDGQIAKMLKKLSADDSMPVFPEHLAYELVRFRAKSSKFPRWPIVIGIVAAFVFESWWLLVAAIALAFWLARRAKSAPSDYSQALDVARRFDRINQVFPEQLPSPHSLDPTLGERAKRVLVCSNQRFADYLQSTEFPLENICPVLGPELAEIDRYAGLTNRFGVDQELKVLLLTDYSPAGLAFRQQLPPLIASHANVTCIGLNEEFVDALKPALRPNSTPAVRDVKRADNGAMSVELFAMRPLIAIGLMAVALDSLAMVPPTGQESNMSFEGDSE